jgi:hypothetical protein
MNKRAVFLCVPLALLLLAAVAVSWQKPADPPAGAKAAPAATAPAGANPAAPTSAGAKGVPSAKEAAPPQPTGFPTTGESLNYQLNWPGGASLGEAHLQAAKTDAGWRFDFSLDASVPGFPVSDHYRSSANAAFCSLELEKETTHGRRQTHEKTEFDYAGGSATRTTLVEGGGHTAIDINNCAHDGLDYVFYARNELGQGHGVPQEQDVLFGAPYSVRMQFAGVQDITVAGKRRPADHVVLYLKGPASDSKLEIFFERNPARTPLLIKAPLPIGTLSMELVR